MNNTPKEPYFVTIKKLRKLKKISQEELAARAFLDCTQLSKIERGISNPTIKTLHKISNALHIPLSKLFEKDRP